MTHFKELSSYPDSFSGSTVLLRILDGIGFRYYWGTEDLNEKDISYTPGNGGRTLLQTLDHLYNMLDFAGNILEDKVTEFPEKPTGLGLVELREKTLHRFSEIRDRISSLTDIEIESKSVKGIVKSDPFEVSLWHLVNGPLLDVMFHLGQITSFRRTTGNPIDPGVQPFFGKKMA